MKKQVVVIHGGETFKTYEDYLAFLKGWRIEPEDLPERGSSFAVQRIIQQLRNWA